MDSVAESSGSKPASVGRSRVRLRSVGSRVSSCRSEAAGVFSVPMASRPPFKSANGVSVHQLPKGRRSFGKRFGFRITGERVDNLPGVPDFNQRNSLIGIPGRQNLPVGDDVCGMTDRPAVIIAQKLQIRIEISARIAASRIAEDSNAGEPDGLELDDFGRLRIRRVQKRISNRLQRRGLFNDWIAEAGEPGRLELIRFGRS